MWQPEDLARNTAVCLHHRLNSSCCPQQARRAAGLVDVGRCAVWRSALLPWSSGLALPGPLAHWLTQKS